MKGMIARSYIVGSDNALRPIASITRGEVFTILNTVFAGYYDKAETVTADVDGSALVNVPGATLKNMKISGDLLVAAGVGTGDLTLDNVTIAGKLVVHGGGVDSIHIKGGKVANLIISCLDGAVRVVTEGGAVVESTYVDDGKDSIIIEGTFNNVQVSAQVPVTFKNAKVGTVTATGENANVTVDKGSKVDTVATGASNTTITVAGTVTNVAATKEAAGAKLNVSVGGTATNVVTAAPNTVVANDGKVGTLSMTKDADTKYVAGDKSTMPKFTAEDKAGLTVTTAAAEKAAAEQAAADKALADATSAEAKAAAEAAKAAADKAAADAKAAADKAAADAAKKTEEKPVAPPVIKDDGGITVPEAPKPDVPSGGGSNPGPSTSASVSNKADLKTALANAQITTITVSGPIGSTSAYDVYTVDHAVTIKGGAVYGSFIVKADGVTFDGISIFNKGDINAGEMRNAINAHVKTLTVRDCTFTSGNEFANGVVIFPSDAAVTYTITGNTFTGYTKVTAGYSTSGLVITQNYPMSDKPFFGVTAGASKVPTMSKAQHQAIMEGNTFTNCKIGYSVSDWDSDYKAVCVGIEGGDLDQLNLSLALGTGSLFFVKRAVTSAVESKTVKANSELIVLKDATLTIPAGKTLANNGTITGTGTIVNDGALGVGVTDTAEVIPSTQAALTIGTLANNGQAYVAGDMTVTTLLTQAAGENAGQITVKGGSVTINNKKIFEVAVGAEMEMTGAYTTGSFDKIKINKGTVTLLEDYTVRDSGSAIQLTVGTNKADSAGALVVSTGKTLTIAGGAWCAVNARGTLTNNGIIDGTGTLDIVGAATGTAIENAEFSCINSEATWKELADKLDEEGRTALGVWGDENTPGTMPWIAVVYKRTCTDATVSISYKIADGELVEVPLDENKGAYAKAFVTVNADENVGLATGTYEVTLTVAEAGGLTTTAKGQVVVTTYVTPK